MLKAILVFAVNLFIIMPFEVFASSQNVDVVPLSEMITPINRVNFSRIQSDIVMPSLPGQLTATSGIPVGCTQTALTDAINAGNLAGSAVLKLPSNCTYLIQTPATDNEAFPIITGNIIIIGAKETVIARSQTAALFRLFTVKTGATLTLRHLAIQNGQTTGLGGGVLDNGTLLLDNVILSNNQAGNGGGIAVTEGATAQVFTSTFLSNIATGVGGGALINFGNLSISNSFLSGNTAPVNGGAINTQSSGTTSITVSLITYNTAGNLGGGLSNLGITNVSQSIIDYNTGSAGGGIATGNNNVIIMQTTNTAILNNQPDNCTPLNIIDGCVS